MPSKIRHILSQRSQESLIGRRFEFGELTRCLDPDGPLVTWLHGIAGIGKTSLLRAFSAHADAQGVRVLELDCRQIEPTEAGTVRTLCRELETDTTEVDEVVAALSGIRPAVIVAFDNYEVFRLADTWLRRRLIPELEPSVRILFVSREPPPAAWMNAPEWQDLFHTVPLIALSKSESLDFLARAGIEGEFARKVAERTGGHPLALALAARAGERSRKGMEKEDFDGVVAELTRRYLEDVHDSELRTALKAVAVVRRITIPLLGALCPAKPAADTYERLSELSFVERRRDGLAIHDLVRDGIVQHLEAAEPDKLREYQSAAWRLLHNQLREVAPEDFWRCTADIIYLVDNPVVREAFFPSQSRQYTVEPAAPDDGAAIALIAGRHDSRRSKEVLDRWWQRLPEAFHVVRDAAGETVGFYCMARPDQLGAEWMRGDAVAWAWWQHLNAGRSRVLPKALFLRRWLSLTDGEAPCAVQAAAWVDIKRSYLELRPALRRVYLTLQDLSPYALVARELGFSVLQDCQVELDGVDYHTAMLDFGPGSVDGWICGLLGRQLGVTEEYLLDAGGHALILDGKRIELTPLECGVLSMIEGRAGNAVSRSELLHEVWGHDYDGGSNVVDAVVRGLRKKLGDRAGLVETVRGVGYRFKAV